jgi:hypothetical protein
MVVATTAKKSAEASCFGRNMGIRDQISASIDIGSRGARKLSRFIHRFLKKPRHHRNSALQKYNS